MRHFLTKIGIWLFENIWASTQDFGTYWQVIAYIVQPVSNSQSQKDRKLVFKTQLSLNIYILNVAALDETIIPSCLHFSMQNIEQSRGLGRASRWSNVNVNQ